MPISLKPRKLNHPRRSLGLGAALLCWLGMGAIAPLYAQTTSLSNISSEVFACMRRNNRSAAGHVIYDGGSSGRLLIFAAGVGQVGEMSYSHNASQNSLSVSYVRGRVSVDQVRGGMENTANRCRSGSLN
ncbi:hypothetical protein HNI00_05285 [Thermoleptolyngbya oregonensis NK1-22]|uniref:Uncharacterized protein n=1 Tax=Thermoleptolyngbya oregonensis NK1-22 TaxID=2547457 RepID=A0AA96Y689_9CYAN|nr:hypothetical protein [Thermoleptolyngbya oregonensis]WOB42633.1 hypothetical protein HNI00_05285 [Thermoleptolyngbya oregonensis NK1-22]